MMTLWLLALQLLFSSPFESFQNVAIQDRGRIKPFDTFARESVLFITGKKSWQHENPTETICSWFLNFENQWQDAKFIYVGNHALKTELSLSVSQKHFSVSEIEGSNLKKKLQEIRKKQQANQPLSPLEKKVVELSNQLGLLRSIVSAEAIRILPHPKSMQETWFSLSFLAEESSLPYDPKTLETLQISFKKMVDGYRSHTPELHSLVTTFKEELQKASQGSYPSQSILDIENHYNSLRPFRLGWILYTFSFILFLFGAFYPHKALTLLQITSLGAAFLVHIYGIVLRCVIAGRPPVTNMYESVVWVSFGCVFFSILIWMSYKKSFIPFAASVFSIVCLVLVDNIPNVLDPGIHPLEPVLRSNFWLTIHVLTITLSYSAFALSLCLGNVVLGNYLFRPKASATIQAMNLYMYRAMQIGVVLLAAGTILGGVWADYSWGRFWGWDPKEVWALVALLIYLAVLHGRFAGWLKGFGFVSATVISFLGILMAWYGVNFVLGVGLHSYGFGTGGFSYVLGYIILQVSFIFVAHIKYKAALKDGELDTRIFPK